MLVASNMAPIWRHAQSSRPFCGGADADVQTTEHRKWTPDWLVWTFAIISQKTEQATETLLNHLANIPHPEMAFARWLALVLRQWEQSSRQPEEEKSKNKLSTAPEEVYSDYFLERRHNKELSSKSCWWKSTFSKLKVSKVSYSDEHCFLWAITTVSHNAAVLCGSLQLWPVLWMLGWKASWGFLRLKALGCFLAVFVIWCDVLLSCKRLPPLGSTGALSQTVFRWMCTTHMTVRTHKDFLLMINLTWMTSHWISHCGWLV